MSTVWQVDASYIRTSGDIDPKNLLITPEIKNFLDIDRDTIYFIVATKGFGKTLFLRYKRLLYQEKYHSKSSEKSSILLIPKNELVDKHTEIIIFDKTKLNLFKTQANWDKIWFNSIILSIFKNLIKYCKKGDDSEITDILKAIRKLPIVDKLLDKAFNTPFDFLGYFLNIGYKEFYEYRKELAQLGAMIRGVRIPTAIFIDNVDQFFKEHLKNDTSNSLGVFDSDIWYKSQMGLINAVLTISNINGHIKVFASIRKEVIFKYKNEDEMALQSSGNIIDVNYSKNDLKKIFVRTINRMDEKNLLHPKSLDKDPIFSFLGIHEIENSYSDEVELIFDYIYRHTLKRPRDLMHIGLQLENLTSKTNVEIMGAINNGATDIAIQYINEISPHINFTIKKFEEIFKLINANILSKKMIRDICSEYNNQRCENIDCKKCASEHIFCTLYKIGFLGIINKDMVENKFHQKFLSPGEMTFEKAGILPNSYYYFIHPVLNMLIANQNTNFTIDETIVGDNRNLRYKKEYHLNEAPHSRAEGYNDRDKNENCMINDTSDRKKNALIISSNDHKDFINELSEKLKIPNFHIRTWVKDGYKTGLIFADKLHPLISESSLIIAEISDLSPNVFFEAGYAIGLTRDVCLIKKKDVKLKINLVYRNYNNMDDLLNQFDGFDKHAETFSTIDTFTNIKNFNSPKKRKKNNEQYVLSFNQESEIIAKLKNYKCNIVSLDILESNFVNIDLVNKLIDSKVVLVKLEGKQSNVNKNHINDAKLLFLTGICLAQDVPIRIYQFNEDFYTDVQDFSICAYSITPLIEYVNSIPHRLS